MLQLFLLVRAKMVMVTMVVADIIVVDTEVAVMIVMNMVKADQFLDSLKEPGKTVTYLWR